MVSRRIDAAAAIAIILAGIAMLYLWRLNPEFRALHVGEPFVDANQFIPGANFHQLGFIKLRFTADYAIGPEAYHPFYYTHNPPLSEIINGLYHRLGLVRIEQQRLVCILWTLIGFIFFYATLKLLTTPAIALVGLIFAVTNPYVIYWGDNLFSSHQWMFIYAAFYFFLLSVRRSRAFLFAAWAAFFCASFCNYEVILLVAFFALGLKLFRLENISRRQLLIFLSAPLAAFLLRNLLVVWAIGYRLWSRDLVEIFLHRTWGIVTGLNDIYKQNPILLWVPEPVIADKYPWVLYIRLERLYGYGWGLLLLAVCFPFLRRRLLQSGVSDRLLRLMIVFFIMGIAWYIFFPQHTSEHFHSLPMLFLLPFASLVWGSVAAGLWKNIRHLPLRIFSLALILSAITAARVSNFIPPRPFPGIEALRRYEGKVFCTNAIPMLVEYYTKVPAAFCGYDGQLKDLDREQYYFFMRTDKMPSPRPEFFFGVYGYYDAELASCFTLVERGRDYAIYDLRKKKGNIGEILEKRK